MSTTSERIHRRRPAGELGSSHAHEPPFTAWQPTRLPRQGGEPLDTATRVAMESDFGVDFGRVRVHDGPAAAASADSVGAHAFTFGSHIVFGPGAYRPTTPGGRGLLAHELSHVVQQSNRGPVVQRAPQGDDVAAKAEKEAQELQTRIFAHAEYTKLNAGAKAELASIVALAKARPAGTAKGQRHYYLTKLLLLLDTPFNGVSTGKTEYGCSPDIEKKNRKKVEQAVQLEEKFLNPFADLEEQQVATGTKKVKRAGQGGKKFEVDRSDPRNIRVLIKVRLTGKKEEVDSIKKLEDAIEWQSHTKGYWLDIVFVNTSGSDVFDFTVRFCEWANSGNWASGPTTLSHEVHHALGLPDRYDYIESHATNRDMDRPMRIHWFLEQMGKLDAARNPFSKMATSGNPLLAEDVCAVAFPAGPERQGCIQARKDLDPAGVPPI